MKTTTFVALVAGAEFASATYSWQGANPFSCPGNTPVICEDKQKTGFNWDDLSIGKFTNYADFQFSGFECASSFGGGRKRDQLTGRTFQDKCITGSAGPDKSNAPSFSCGGSKAVPNFSVDEFHITPEFDCDLQFHYTMPDKSTCKQTHACSKSGTIVKNKQCGGATDVHVIYPNPPKGKPSKCSIGIHSIGFQCSSTTKPTTKPATTKPATTKPTTAPGTTKASTTKDSTKPAETTPATSTKPAETTPATSTKPAETTPATSTKPAESTPATSTKPAETTPILSSTSSAQGSTTTPITDVTTTVIIDTTTSICPVTTTHTTKGTTSLEVGTSTATVKVTRTQTTCHKCTGKPTKTSSPPASSQTPAGTTSISTAAPVGSSTSTPSVPSSTDEEDDVPSSTEAVPTSSPTKETPAPPADCPVVLPQCLNTWMFSSECADNTDASCFCKSSEYVCNVFDCLSAHGTPQEIASATTYMQGICAPYIDVNSAIITCAAPPTTPNGNSSIPVVPTLPEAVTTIQILTTVTVPCSTSGTAIPGSSTASVISTAITVPQVVFQTQSAEGTSSAALVVGTPAPATVPAGIITTAAPPAATTLATLKPTGANASSTAQPTQFQSNDSSQLSLTFGSLFVAALVAVFAM